MTDDACCEPGDCKSGRLRIGAVVLAAGEGARLGGRAKGLIEIDGEPLLLRTLRVLSEVGVDDVVVVTRLDRLARSTRDLLDIAETLNEKGAGLRSLAEPWADTTKTKEELDMASHIGLTSDKNLAVDEPSLDYIRAYAADQDKFFADFSKVYVKMTTMGAKFA